MIIRELCKKPFCFNGFVEIPVTSMGTSWVSVSTLPYSASGIVAVSMDDGIHILGGGGTTNHYKWNGSSWVSVSTLPFKMSDDGIAIVLNNEIHLMGGSYGETSHYKWNGSSWVSVSTLPFKPVWSSSVIVNDELHILGGTVASSTSHYKWDGSSWTSVSILPYTFTHGVAVNVDDYIHIMGTNYGSSSSYYTKHYKWDGSSWTSVSALPFESKYGTHKATVVNDVIYILHADANKQVYSYKNGSWTSITSLINYQSSGSLVVFQDCLHVLGNVWDSGYYKTHYKLTLPCVSRKTNLPYGVKIYHPGVNYNMITPISGCLKQSDGGLLVNSPTGNVKFRVAGENCDNYSVY